MKRTMAIAGIALVVIIVMLFTLPDLIGFELTMGMVLTLSVLIGIYVILITEAINRTTLAMFGALLIIIILIQTELIPAHDTVDFVIGAIDFNTIGLLLGMMIIVGILGETGIFQYIGIKAAKLAKGNVWKLMLLFSVITAVGSAFMESFNQFYYSFSPTIADFERQNPVFKEAVKLTITPLLTSLSLLNYVDTDSEVDVLGYGISLILLNVGMYFVAPTIIIVKIGNRFRKLNI